jgi:hypothetical protein
MQIEKMNCDFFGISRVILWKATIKKRKIKKLKILFPVLFLVKLLTL